MKLLLGAMVSALCVHASTGAAAVYKCTDATGRTVYADQACGKGAREQQVDVQAAPSLREGRFEPGTTLDVPPAVIRECYDGYRAFARDPTSAKMLYASTTVPKAGIPIVVVEAVFANKFGGPERRSLWCRLTDDLQIDKAETEKRQRAFFIDQQDMSPELRRLIKP